IRRAETLANNAGIIADPMLQRLRAEVEAEDRDRRLFVELEDIYQALSQRHPEGRDRWAEELKRYRAVFAARGLEPERTSGDAAAAAIRRYRATLRAFAVASLDYWYVAAAGHDQERAWLRGVVQAADPDAWRTRVRTAMYNKD